MSRSWSGAAGFHVDMSGTPVTAPPLTLAAYVNMGSLTDSAGSKAIITSGASGGINNTFSLRVDTSGHVLAQTRNTGNAIATTSTTLAISGWHLIAAVFTSAASRFSWLDNGGNVLDTSSRTPTGVNAFRIGGELDDSQSRMNGLIAYAGVWNIDLTATQLLALYVAAGSGKDFRTVAKANLVDYWSLDTNASPEVPLYGSDNLTVTSATYSASNPTIAAYSAGGILLFPPGMNGMADLTGAMA